MEKTKLGFVFLLDINGAMSSWDSIWKISDKDNNGNSLVGNVFNQNTKNCYLRSEGD